MQEVDSLLTSMDHRVVKTIMQNDRWNRANAKAYNRYRLVSRRQNWTKLLAKELLSVPADATILEVGAGTGFLTEILLNAGYRVLATDLSPSMLALAARNVKTSGVESRVRFVEGDAESLQMKDDTFAAVVSRWVLWTLPRPRKALTEMVRTLAPGGRLVLIDGQHRKMKRLAHSRSAFVDFLLTGRFPSWRSQSYNTAASTLPRLDAPEVASILKELGLKRIASRRLSDKEGDGFIRNWLTGHAWESYLVTGTK